MADKGGQTTQAGIDYQNKIATLFMGRMIDPGPWTKNEEITGICNEDPSAEVDDVVLTYQDHTTWIQVKLNMADNGDTWIKFWKHMIKQRWDRDHAFKELDRLVLAISTTPDWVRQLEEICGKAYGSRKSTELSTLEQQVAEWKGRLSFEQKLLISNIVADLSGKERLKGKLDRSLTLDAIINLMMGGPVLDKNLETGSLFYLFSQMEVWTQFNPNKIESDHGRSFMPKATQEWFNLFDILYRYVGKNALYGKSISRSELIQKLNQKNISILGSASLIPVAAIVPEQYIHRRGIEIPLVRCLRRKPNGVSPTIIGLVGNGGFGKTDLARAAANDPRVLKKYPDGVLWIEIGQTPDLRSIFENQIKALTGKSPGFVGVGETGLNEAAQALAQELRSRRILIVLDDLWHGKPLDLIKPGAIQSAILITTRLREIAPLEGIIDVGEMENQEAARLLVSWMAAPPHDLSPFSELAAKLGEWPLLVELATTTLKEYVQVDLFSLEEAISQLKERLAYYGFTAFDRRDENDRRRAIAVNMNISLERLEKLDRLGNVRPRYLELAVFPKEEDVPFMAIEKLWKSTGGMERIPVEDALRAMHRLSLFNRYDARRRTLRLHDVIHAYLENQVKDYLPALHSKLLDGYRLNNWIEMPFEEPYLWQKVAMHLGKAGRNSDLYKLISEEWMEAKLRRFGSHESFAADVNLAIQAARQETPPNIVQLVRDCLIYATLVSQASQVPPDALGRLAQFDQAGAALGYAALNKDATRRSEAYRLIGEALVRKKELEMAESALYQALAATQVIQDKMSKAWMLSQVAVAFGDAGLVKDAGQTANQALTMVQAFQADKGKVLVLSNVAKVLTQVGLVEDAAQAARQALTTVQSIQDEGAKAEMFNEVVGILAQAGDQEGVQQTITVAQSIQDEGIKLRALIDLAKVLAQSGSVEQALTVVQAIPDAYSKSSALRELAGALAQAGDQKLLQQAITVAQSIQDEGIKLRALSDLAKVLAQAGSVEQALTAVQDIQEGWYKTYALSEIVGTLAQAGDQEGVQQTITVAQSIQDEGIKSRALSDLAKVLAQAGSVGQALRAIRTIGFYHSKSLALIEVVGVLAQAGNQEGLRQALDSVLVIQDEEFKERALSELAEALAQVGLAEQALAVIQATQDEWSRVERLSGVSIALAQAGFVGEASQAARQALMLAQPIQSTFFKARELNKVVVALDKVGLSEEANLVAKQIFALTQASQTEDDKILILLEIVDALAKVGFTEDAAQTANQVLTAIETVQDKWTKIEYLKLVVGRFADLGLVEQALATARTIQDEGSKAWALLIVSETLSNVGLVEEAILAARQSLAAAHVIQDDWINAKALGALAKALAQAGYVEEADQTAGQALTAVQALQDEEFRLSVLQEVTETLAEAGLQEQSLAAAQCIQSEWFKAHILCLVSKAMIQIGSAEDAVSVAKQALTTAQTIQNEETKSQVLREVVEALTQVGLVEEASQAARQALVAAQSLQDEFPKSRELVDVAVTLSRIDKDQAVPVLLDAIQFARLVDRESFFDVIERGAFMLTAVDNGLTLWKIYQAIMAIEAWW